VADLESELDRLYALDPGEFVAERDRLARELRDSGEREEAEQVKGLRKPTVSAATINQLARQERREVDLLLDAGHRLREAQQRLLAGEEPGSLDEARRNEREALRNLRKASLRILNEAGRASETTLSKVMATLQAAAVSDEGRELLARGRLTGDLEAPGFDLLAPMAPGAPKRTRKPKPPPARKPRPDRRKLERARAKRREAQEAAKAADENLRAAERDANKARRELERAEKQLRDEEKKSRS
jgi:hypothetical protein